MKEGKQSEEERSHLEIEVELIPLLQMKEEIELVQLE